MELNPEKRSSVALLPAKFLKLLKQIPENESQEYNFLEETSEVSSQSSLENLCKKCGTKDNKKFTAKKKDLCRDCKNYKNPKIFLCKYCGEIDSDAFLEGRYTTCKKCKNKKCQDSQRIRLSLRHETLVSKNNKKISLEIFSESENDPLLIQNNFEQIQNVGFGDEIPEVFFHRNTENISKEEVKKSKENKIEISPESFKRNLHFYFSTDISFLKGITFSKKFENDNIKIIELENKIKHFEEQMLDFKSDNDVIRHLTRNHEFISELLGVPNIYKKDK